MSHPNPYLGALDKINELIAENVKLREELVEADKKVETLEATVRSLVAKLAPVVTP